MSQRVRSDQSDPLSEQTGASEETVITIIQGREDLVDMRIMPVAAPPLPAKVRVFIDYLLADVDGDDRAGRVALLISSRQLKATGPS